MSANEKPSARILVADDQSAVLEAVRLLLKREAFQVETARSPRQVLGLLRTREFDVLLIDLNYTRDTTSGQEGLDLLTEIRELDGTLPVVVMTAWGSIELAVEAMRRGARDFIQKPWENQRLEAILRTQTELGRALRQSRRLEAEIQVLRDQKLPRLIADSEAMEPVLEMIERVGPSDANILITGDNGTGKGVVAHHLHAVSRRAAKPLVTVNTGGLPEGVFESEVFGHVKGAYTDAKANRIGRFEMADGGTLFLDEISNISLNEQAKLLRVLESGEFEPVGSSKTRIVDVRVFSATNADLKKAVGEGRFRRDLYFRLNTIEIHLPPLNQRQKDLPLLAEYFLQRHVRRYGKKLVGFDDAALQAMRDYPWPGNVRELDHAVERAVLMAKGARVQVADLGLGLPRSGANPLEGLSLEEVERLLIQKALVRCGGNVRRAAEVVGLSRSALYRRLQRYGL